MIRCRIVGPLSWLGLLLLPACARSTVETGAAQQTEPSTATLVATVTGLAGPESVRYDPDQDVYFVSNFNGPGNARDNNGFISRVLPDGTIDRLRFIAGGEGGVTLHAPRGMTIVGDTLWVADADAVRGFHRRTGAPVASVDFTALGAGFLNDVTAGPDGTLYVTDTPRNRVYRIAGRTASIVLEDTVLNQPNGITWDRTGNRAIVLPFGGKRTLLGWEPGGTGLQVVATLSGGGRYDGVEVLARERLLVSSQADSSLYIVTGSQSHPIARTTGAPADIGVDTRRNRVAVPYVALNRVDIWQLPRSYSLR